MKKVIIKVVVLLLVFVGALGIFSLTMNRGNKDLTITMAQATLPIMHFYNGTIQINELHGYVKEMDAVGMREDITPVGEDRLLRMSIDTYGKKIDNIRYEVRSMDAKRLIAEADVEDYEKISDKITAEIKMQNILEPNLEYLLIFTLDSENQTIYYYTRMLQVTDDSASECLNFALKFHENTFLPEGRSFFPTYMDEATGDATTLNYVDLTCTVKQIMWADFKGEILVEPIASFKEINSSYDVITLEYVISNTNENGETEVYNVEEYFRLRLTETRMYVLNYERTMNQMFRGENNFLEDTSKIQLGIRNRNVEFKANEAGNIICFVQEGELWCYNQGNREIAKIFSFRDMEGFDHRNIWNQHDIKIVRIDEAGSVDFMVYGYMNRGTHEGEVGTIVYHYDGLAHTVEEEVFIPYSKSYEILRAEMGQLMYENDQGILYIMQEGNVYRIDLNTLKTKKEISGLTAGCYAASENNEYFAWVDTKEQYKSTVLHLLNLKTGAMTEIEEGSGRYLRPLGFIDGDFIYGIANAKNVKVDAAGNTMFPMKSLKILNTSEDKQEVLKEYAPSGKLIGGIEIEDYTIFVQLVKASGGQYVAAGTDSIMNRDADKTGVVSVGTTISDVKETQVHITLKKNVESSKVKMITSKGVLQEDIKELELKQNSNVEQDRFYVYVKGNVIHITDGISDAISYANKKMGVVIDSGQQYVWMRARKIYSAPLSDIEPSTSDKGENAIVKCISAMLTHEKLGLGVSELMDTGLTPKEVLENTLKDAVVLDLTGCVTEDILFYVSKGSPVFAMTGSKNAVLVIGYTGTNINYYDPETDKISTVTFEKADEMFQLGGNKFITYLWR